MPDQINIPDLFGELKKFVAGRYAEAEPYEMARAKVDKAQADARMAKAAAAAPGQLADVYEVLQAAAPEQRARLAEQMMPRIVDALSNMGQPQLAGQQEQLAFGMSKPSFLEALQHRVGSHGETASGAGIGAAMLGDNRHRLSEPDQLVAMGLRGTPNWQDFYDTYGNAWFVDRMNPLREAVPPHRGAPGGEIEALDLPAMLNQRGLGSLLPGGGSSRPGGPPSTAAERNLNRESAMFGMEPEEFEAFETLLRIRQQRFGEPLDDPEAERIYQALLAKYLAAVGGGGALPEAAPAP